VDQTEPAWAVRELELSNAHLRGQLESTTQLLVEIQASEVQLQLDLEQRRIELESALHDLVHYQGRARDRQITDEGRIEDLKERLVEESRLRAEAERERQAVIASLSRSTRRRLRRATAAS
jgi:hypothetical protein